MTVSATVSAGLVTVPAEPVDAPVIVRLVVPFGVPGALLPEQPAKVAKTSVAVANPSRMRGRRAENSRSSKIPATTSGTTCRIDSGGIGLDIGGNIKAVVVTVTVEVCAVTPSAAAREAGAGVQVAKAGAPEQAIVTA